ncbi:hypothetical protein B0H16DRAFT_1736465 [Mycena metata]|uniref:F-box domain-containing protein n=1 Tax=Mycena metata TaxID=1033252 RepID=A0AAD7HNV5_9AGAR|nr:hypothetical protein B0H16DRAFT_1736465 [Mycena metata]
MVHKSPRLRCLPSSNFLDLVEDVLVLILGSYCDVATVLALSQTSKYLNRLAFSKTIWFSLVSTLVERRFIDSQPDDNSYLGVLSTEQIMGLVKRALQGPKTWQRAEPASAENRFRPTLKLFKYFTQPPSCPPVESRRMVLHPEITPSPLPSNWSYRKYEHRAKLVPGGRYLLYQNYNYLECWSAFQNRLVWKQSTDDSTVSDFDAAWDEDNRLVIVVARNRNTQAFVEVHILDLESKLSDRVLSSRVPHPEAWRRPVMQCAIRGDFVTVYLSYYPREVLLINWRKRSRVMVVTGSILLCPGPYPSSAYQITLTPEHLILARADHLAFSSLSLLFSFWESINEDDEPSSRIGVHDIFVDVIGTIPLTGYPADHRRVLWVFDSPLQRGQFRVWVHTIHNGLPKVCGYEYSIRGTRLSWRSLASFNIPGNSEWQVYP